MSSMTQFLEVHRLVMRTRRSKTPPHRGALSRLNLQSTPLLLRYSSPSLDLWPGGLCSYNAKVPCMLESTNHSEALADDCLLI